MSRTRVTHVVDLYARVKADPRVQAAQAAKDAFYSSEAGQQVMATMTLRQMMELPEDVKQMFEAHTKNYNRTFQAVKYEILLAEGVIEPGPAVAA